MNKGLLETLVLQVTTKCPHRCPQCYMQRGDEEMNFEIAQRMVAFALEENAKAIQLTGGEPLVYSYLMPLIEQIHREGMYSFLATSGYRLSPSLAKELKDRGLTLICISINDILEEENAKTRNDWCQSLMAVSASVEAGLPCFGNVVVTDDNISRLNVLGDYLLSKGVEEIHLLRPYPSFDGQYRPKISRDTVAKLHETVEAGRGRYRVENCFREYWEYVRKAPFVCGDRGEKTLFVHVDGSVSPCSKMAGFHYASPDSLRKETAVWQRGCCDEGW